MIEAEAPSGWRRLHPATPLLNLFGGGYVLLLFLAFAGSMFDGRIGAPLWPLVAIAVGAVVLAYLRFKYTVTDETLVITEGILFRRRRVIPRSRIQHIDLKAGVIQQLVGVAQARIETAGGRDAEATLRYVSKAEGLRLRDTLVKLPGTADAAEGATAPATVATQPQTEPPTFARRITPLELAVAGATSNRAGVLVGLLLGGNFFFDFIPTDWLLRRVIPPEYLETEAAVRAFFFESAQSDFRAFLIGAGILALVFGLLGWGLSVLLTVVRYFEFTLIAAGRELRVSYGLLTRRETGLRRSRVQNVLIEESILRRWLGLATLRVQTAGYGASVKSEEKMEILAPIARRDDLPEYLGAVFPDLDFSSVQWRRSHPRARRRLFVRRALVVIAASIGFWLLFTPWALLILLGLIPAWLLASLHYRHLGHARLGSYVLTREGLWNRRTYIVPLRKIQALHMRETPFQRRLGLGTVTIETAGSPFEWHAPRSIDLGRAYGLDLMEGLAADVRATGLSF